MWLKESESGWKGKTIPVWVLLFAASFVPDMTVGTVGVDRYIKNMNRNERHAL
jgi:hypothetical protein